SVTKRLLSSTASKAHGSVSCYGMDGALCASAAARGGQCPLSSPRVLHSEVLWTGMHSNLFVTLPRDTEASNAYAIIHNSLGPVCICSLIGINSSACGVNPPVSSLMVNTAMWLSSCAAT